MTPMLARKYNGEEPTDFLISEKLDGVRAIWNGEEFISRSGKTLKAPASKIAQMPQGITLDGELTFGRGTFQAGVGRIRKGDWDGAIYVVFDTVSDAPAEDRLNAARDANLPSWSRVLPHWSCGGQAHLDGFEQGILDVGGEGVMLRRKGSYYDHGRSSDLLKLKRFKTDEATVTGFEEGTGRNEGVVGALLVRMGEVAFKIGSGLSDAMRENPPAVGDLVTFQYFEKTNRGCPRFPSFLAVRDYE